MRLRSAGREDASSPVGGEEGGVAEDKGVTGMTHGVLYAAYEGIGLSTRWVVALSVAAALLMRRDPETLTWVLGACANGAASKVLKVGEEGRAAGCNEILRELAGWLVD